MVVKKQRDLVWKSADKDWDTKKMKLKIYTGFWSVEDGYQTCIVYVNYSYNKGKLCHIASWLAYYWESNFCNQLVCAGIRMWITQKHQSTQQHCNSQLEAFVTLSLMYGLLTKREVKMAGYWPSSFFLCVYGPRWSRGSQSQRKIRFI